MVTSQMKLARLVFAAVLAAALARFAAAAADAPKPAWQPQEMAFTAKRDHPWWEFPVRAVFCHNRGTTALTIEGFWDGGRHWVIRAALPQPGTWAWHTESADPGLAGHSGQIEVVTSPADRVAANPNLRGQVRPASGGRHFEYADGTPCFLLADTLWAGNTARCGLLADGGGPFSEYLADRKAKGFTAVLMQFIHGYGDYPDGQAHRNEGGYAFLQRDPARLNPAYFQALDRRMRTLWERGLLAASPIMWWGKTKKALFTPQDARRLSAYCAVRYGAFNSLWCVSGEYQYTFADCGWTPADLSALGAEIQRHNPRVTGMVEAGTQARGDARRRQTELTADQDQSGPGRIGAGRQRRAPLEPRLVQLLDELRFLAGEIALLAEVAREMEQLPLRWR